MPLFAPNYSNTILYKLCCKNLNITDVYIGHTTDFKSRKRSHKNSCNKEHNKCYNYNVYNFIRNNGGWDNWEMIMIEYYPCNTNLEATKRERELIEELKATLNSYIPTRTRKEYREDNKIILSTKEQQRIANCKTQINCECGGFYKLTNKSCHIKTKRHQNYIYTRPTL